MPENRCETLLTCRWLLPVAPQNRVFENMAIAITGDQILAVGKADAIVKNWRADNTVELNHHAVLPGLINAHGHAAMTLLRGMAEDKPLQAWLKETIWPVERAHMSEEFVRDGTRLAIAEMLSHGTTTFADMYFFPEVAADLADQIGMRAQIAFPIMDFANAWSDDVSECFHKGLSLRDRYKNHARVVVGFGPHSAYTVKQADLQQILIYAEEIDAPIQIHLHENAEEVAEAQKRVGRSWITYLNDLGLLTRRLQAVHMTCTTPDELDLISATGVSVVHCPRSNLKLSSGACSITDMQDRSINVALGTDGAASNNSLDMFGEMRLAALLAKHQTGRADAGQVAMILHMATLGGATALGIDAHTGSIEAGKAADLVAVDLSGLAFAPVYDPMVQIIHGNSGNAVTDVWVAGRRLIADGRHQSLDLAETIARANQWGGLIRP
ncbi:MAG: TRZ/ATZ family hydrolase [Proteobacteria bacterium]|nr:TRZ/ATZ family hydrolase [Pseudomonadota bacterium]